MLKIFLILTGISADECPSTACWTSDCTLVSSCYEITCGTDLIHIIFDSDLFGIENNTDENPFITEDENCLPSWNHSLAKWKYSASLGGCGASVERNIDDDGKT